MAEAIVNEITEDDLKKDRLKRVLEKPCTRVLQWLVKDKLTKKWENEIGGKIEIRHIFNHGKVKKHIAESDLYEEGWRHLYGDYYPRSKEDRRKDINEYDISLCIWLLNQEFLCDLEGNLMGSVQVIGKYRNQAFHNYIKFIHKHDFDGIMEELKTAVLHIQTHLTGSYRLYTPDELEKMKTADLNASGEDDTDSIVRTIKEHGINVPEKPEPTKHSDDDYIKAFLQCSKRFGKLSTEGLRKDPELRSRTRRMLHKGDWSNDIQHAKDGCLEITLYCSADREVPEKGEVKWLSEKMTEIFVTEEMREFERKHDHPGDMYVKVMVKKWELKHRSEIDPSLLLLEDTEDEDTPTASGKKMVEGDMVKEVIIVADYVLKSCEERILKLGTEVKGIISNDMEAKKKEKTGKITTIVVASRTF